MAVVALTGACCPSAAQAEHLEDTNLKFSLTIPDGFVRDPQLAQAQPDFVYAFRKTEPQDVGVVIIIERMRGTIGRERLDVSKAQPGFAGRVLTVRWHDFELDAIGKLKGDITGSVSTFDILPMLSTFPAPPLPYFRGIRHRSLRGTNGR